MNVECDEICNMCEKEIEEKCLDYVLKKATEIYKHNDETYYFEENGLLIMIDHNNGKKSYGLWIGAKIKEDVVSKYNEQYKDLI